MMMKMLATRAVARTAGGARWAARRSLSGRSAFALGLQEDANPFAVAPGCLLPGS